MIPSIITADFSKFGYRELQLASELLQAYLKQGAEFLTDGITLNFNINSGFVFLSDEDYNVAMLNGEELEQFFSCPECGTEGFKEEFEDCECKQCREICYGYCYVC